MGCGPLLRRKSGCTGVIANLRRSVSAIRTPSVAARHLPLRGEEEPAPPYVIPISIRLGPSRSSAFATAAPIAVRSSARTAGTPIDVESA
jgi:hypothetical protein